MRMAALAESAYYSRSRLSHRISRMEARDLVQRESTAADKRGVVVSLSDASFETLRRAAPDNLRTVRDHFIDVIEPRGHEPNQLVMSSLSTPKSAASATER